jgi:hypothetical protein
VPRGAETSPITIQQKQLITGLQGDSRFESKYLKAKALLKANIRKQLAYLKAKIVECQCGSSMMHGETRSRKRDAIPWKSGLKTTKCFIQPHPPNDPPILM